MDSADNGDINQAGNKTKKDRKYHFTQRAGYRD